MRLPAVTKKQIDNEDARAFHEQLWAAHQEGRPLVMPTGELMWRAENFAQQVSWSKAGFWHNRGYSLRVKDRGETTEVSLVASIRRQRKAA